jgi:hypothetical protein
VVVGIGTMTEEDAGTMIDLLIAVMIEEVMLTDLGLIAIGPDQGLQRDVETLLIIANE